MVVNNLKGDNKQLTPAERTAWQPRRLATQICDLYYGALPWNISCEHVALQVNALWHAQPKQVTKCMTYTEIALQVKDQHWPAAKHQEGCKSLKIFKNIFELNMCIAPKNQLTYKTPSNVYKQAFFLLRKRYYVRK